MEQNTLLKMVGITKTFPGVKALDGVNLEVKAGTVHALMGENGAGKSTLMKCLFGMYAKDEGHIYLEGKEIDFKNSKEALDNGVAMVHQELNQALKRNVMDNIWLGRYPTILGGLAVDEKKMYKDTMAVFEELGIGMVHQEFMLIPGFTVAENVKLGREISTETVASSIFGKSLERLDKPAMAEDTRAALNTIGLGVEDYARVAGMPVGYMQFIEIAREIDKTGIKLLIFDEPTAVLTETEAERLLETMRVIASKGIAIIFITHRINEVIEVTDSMTVLRDGTFVDRLETKDTTAARIAELMIGRQVEKLVDDMEEDTRKISDDDIMLSLKNFYVDMPGEKVKGIDLKLRRGEILGIGGLAGQGKVGVPNGILGLYPAAGEIEFDGQKIDPSKLGDALHKGIAFVSEDRRGVGLLLNESIEQNIIFTALQIQGKFLKKYGPFSQFDAKGAKNHALDMIKALDIRCTGPEQYAGRLSGGNQQKVCLARAITMEPKLLIVSEPTRGIDIGAKKLVLELLAKMNREQGMTIIMVSSELNELRSLCDRIAIVSDGKLTGIFAPEASDAEYGLAMSGVTEGGKV